MFLLVPAYPGGPGQKAVKRLCVCACMRVYREIIVVRCGCFQYAIFFSTAEW